MDHLAQFYAALDELEQRLGGKRTLAECHGREDVGIVETGLFLRNHLPPDAEVLALEIGVLGYFGERRILDYGALVSPRFTAAKFTGTRPRLVAELLPDYIVDIEHNTMIGEVLEQPELAGRYVEIASFTDVGFAHGAVRVLERRDPP